MPTPGFVSDIPGAATALQTVAEKLKDFDATGPSLVQMMHQAATLKAMATANGNATAADKAAAQLKRIQSLYKVFGTINDKLDPVRDWLQRSGFGVVVIPVIIAAAAVAAVVGMVYVITGATTERRELDALAAGTLTPEQLVELRRTGGNRSLVNLDFGKAVPWVAGIGALWLFGPRILKALRGATS